MNIDEQDPDEQGEAGETFKRIEKHLEEEDKKLQQVDEAIQEAERKSKTVIRDPEP